MYSWLLNEGRRSPFWTRFEWRVTLGSLTQSGQNDVCRLPLTDWPKDLGQEGVGTHRDDARLSQVGARVIVQVEQLLQLLHCLQGKAPLSNLEKNHNNGTKCIMRVCGTMWINLKTTLAKKTPKTFHSTLNIGIFHISLKPPPKKTFKMWENPSVWTRRGTCPHLNLHGRRASVHGQHQDEQNAGRSHSRARRDVSQVRGGVLVCLLCCCSASFKVLDFRLASDLLTRAARRKPEWGANTGLVREYVGRIPFFTL